MPTELRRIALSAEETMQAIQSYARMAPHFQPHGRVLGFRLAPGGEGGGVDLTITVEAIHGAARAAREVRAEQADVVELLVRCCLENNIPIPRGSARSAVVAGGLLALVVRHDSELLLGE